MKLHDFVIVKITFFFILGIVFGFYFDPDKRWMVVILTLFLFLFLIEFIRSNKRFIQAPFFGIIAYTFIFLVGIGNSIIHQQKNWKNHYSHSIKEQKTFEIQFRVSAVLKPTDFYNRYEVLIQKLDTKKVSGKLLVNIIKDTTKTSLKVDDLLFVKTNFSTVKPVLNPHQFDYKRYLERKNIYHQLYSKRDDLLLLKNKPASIYGWTDRWRNTIKKSLAKNDFKEEELAIIYALILGQKQDISEETYTNYAKAGAIHILAVSGLHIGIIVLLLTVLLQPLSYLKKGNTLKIAIIILFLWGFAILSGLSPSVVRAVTMFSFITVAMHRKKQSNSYVVLISAAFFILLFKPEFIFEIGFQLSYLAVFAIIWIQPLIYALWVPKYTIVRYFWQLASVSFAAQLGVFPMSLFYFHQFPGLFFLSNLVIIPFLGLILGLGIIIIVLNLINITPTILIKFYSLLIHAMNQFVAWIASKEAFLWKDIYFDWKFLLLLSILIMSSVSAFKKWHPKKLILVFISILLLQSVFIYNKIGIQNTQKLIVFHKNRRTLIALEKQNTLLLYSDKKENVLKDDRTLINYRVGANIKNFRKEGLKNVIQLNNKRILIIDSFGVYQIPKLKVDYILLSNSPKINLKRLINRYQPQKIIADGNNYKSFIKRWKATCLKEKVPFHYTGEKGAFILDF